MANTPSVHIGQLFIHHYSHKSRSTCKLFVSTPSAVQEQSLGKLFGIIEFNTPSRENATLIAQLIDTIEHAYYGAYEAGADQDVAQLFEQALAASNDEFIKLLKSSPAYLIGTLNESNITEKINLCVGVLKGTSLILSHLNSMGIFIVHRTKQDFSLIDVAAASDTDADPAPAGRLFSHIISGSLAYDDYLCLTNGSVLDFISRDRLKKTVSGLAPHKAAEYLKNSLLQYDGYNFATLIVHQHRPESAAPRPHALASIEELNTTEGSTERLLSPSLVPSVQSIIGALAGKKKQQTLPGQLAEPSELKKVATATKRTVERAADAASQATSRAVGKIMGEGWSRFFSAVTRRLSILRQRIASVPHASKWLLAGAAVATVVLVVSVAWSRQERSQTTVSTAFSESAAAVEQLIAQAQSRLIVGDEAGARPIVTQAQQGLAAVPVDSARERENYQRLDRSIQQLVAQLRKITIVGEPMLLVTLAPTGTTFEARGIAVMNEHAYVVDGIARTLYDIDLIQRTVRPIVTGAQELSQTRVLRAYDRRLYAVSDRGLFAITPSTAVLTPIAIDAPETITDINFYNSRLYTLRAATGSITRYPFDGSSVGAGVAWLRESADLSGAISMGIDTNIWVGTASGTVRKFTKGAPASFSLTQLEPPITATNSFFTRDESNYLYSSDPSGRRIAVFDKSGNLITQYYSDQFNDMRALAVDEEKKTAYVANGSAVYAFPLSHLK